jgi:hypothetical protein
VTTATKSVEALVQDVLAQDEPAKPITSAPIDPSVVLPGGYQTLRGIVTDAEVRELTGEDEEAIARATTPGKLLDTILNRGTVSIGGTPADSATLDALLAGDRDALLVAIRRVTFGDEMVLNAHCQHCATDQEVTMSLGEDVPVTKLPESAPRLVEVDCKAGRIVIAPLAGVTQRKLLDAQLESNYAERTTILLRGCVNSINGLPVVDDLQVRRLVLRDRTKLVEEIGKLSFGPDMGAIVAPCVACEKEMKLPLSLVDIFRG